MSDAEIMTEFLKRFYVDAAYIPDELIVRVISKSASCLLSG